MDGCTQPIALSYLANVVSKKKRFKGKKQEVRHVSLIGIFDCHILRLLPHFLHNSAKCTHCIFYCINWHFWRQFQYLYFCYLFLLVFVTSNMWLPTECYHPCVLTPVEQDGVLGLKQFCTIFPHKSSAYLLFMQSAYLLKILHKTDMPKKWASIATC